MKAFHFVLVICVAVLNESHLRVSPGGGMVWQEGGKIKFCRLYNDNSGYHFDPVITIDEGDCRNPDIQNTAGFWLEEFLAWEKGSADSPEVWYSQWGWDSGQWSLPYLLFENGDHQGIKFSSGLTEFSSVPMLLSDKTENNGQYLVSAYDFYFQDEFISEFSQTESFQADLFTYEILTENYWESGYMTFRHDEGNGYSDIFSSDEGYLMPDLNDYCRIDSTAQPDVNPQLFEGAWYFSYFDLVCIWESWRNGHWQLFSATTPVVIGNIPETKQEGDLTIKVYPNPFTDFIWLECTNEDATHVIITIYNTFGQEVKSIDGGYSTGGKMSVKIETGDFPQGIYLVKTATGQDVSTIKIIKK
jgi:hypothetical protein